MFSTATPLTQLSVENCSQVIGSLEQVFPLSNLLSLHLALVDLDPYDLVDALHLMPSLCFLDIGGGGVLLERSSPEPELRDVTLEPLRCLRLSFETPWNEAQIVLRGIRAPNLDRLEATSVTPED